MDTKTEIVNAGFAHCGKGTYIENVDDASDTSPEAKLARLFYLPALKLTLREFHWPHATRIEGAQLITEDPNDEWGFSYRYPVDCLDLRRILSGTRNDTADTLAEYRVIGDDAVGQVILCDVEEAQIEYTKLVTKVANMPMDFRVGLSYRLGMFFAPKLAAGDRKLALSIKADFNDAIGQAKLNAAMEGRKTTRDTSCSFVTARG